ncbi:MAG: DUF559 domain-containing protein [Candidatus Binataceae bacterium]
MPHNVVRGQGIDPVKLAQAKQFRQNMTRPERILWQALRGNAVCGLHFRRQQIIGGFIVDFYCHRASLVVEVDGSVHQATTEYDSERDLALSKLGLRVLRLSDEDVERNLRGLGGARLTAILWATYSGPERSAISRPVR